MSLICDICGDIFYTLDAFRVHIHQENHVQHTTLIKREESGDCVLHIKTEANPKQTYENQRTSCHSNDLHPEPTEMQRSPYATANKTKCGDIFQFMEDTFTLVCGKCSEHYYALEAFGAHIFHDHPTASTLDAVSDNYSGQSDNVRIEPREIEPEFVSVSFKEEHDANDINNADISEPSDVDIIKVSKHKKSFKCSFCDKLVCTKRERDDHENMHFGRRPYECYMCQKTYSASSSLKTHLKLHSTDLPHKCLACDKSFIKRIKLEHHIREKHLPATDPRRFFPCKDCQKSFRTYSNMCRHVNTHHKPVKIGTFICDYCHKIFPTRGKIVRHVLHHVVKDIKHKCRFCDKMFTDKYYHKLHESRHRPPRPDEMPQCEICFKSFKYSRGLQRHIKNIHSEKRRTINHLTPTQKTKRPHQCKICKKILTTSSGLRQHIKTHTNDRQHHCLLCGASFMKPFLLTIHHRENHLPDTDPQRYFTCTLCDTQFLTYAKLRYHAIYEHSKRSSLYTCGYCQKEHHFRRHLIRHMLEHFPKTAYKCRVCNRKFKNVIACDEHMNTHAGGSNVKCQCSFCPNSYMHRSSLWRHINIAHKNK